MKMKSTFFWMIAGLMSLTSLTQAQDPEALTCDFEGGLDKWRGDGRIVEVEAGNHVCELKKRGKRTKEITHKIELEGSKSYEIQFRMRAMPESEGVRIRKAVRSENGAGFSGAELKPDGKWVDLKLVARATEGERAQDRTVAIIFMEGDGVVQIDDIKVVVSKR